MGVGSRMNDKNTSGKEEEEGDSSSATPSSSSPPAAGASANNEYAIGQEEGKEDEEGDSSSATPSPSSPPAAGASASASRTMTTVSRHYFENMREDYGMFVWPCARVLAEHVLQQRSRFLGASVLELGAGTSLPGLVAAKVGANVILTDNSGQTELYFTEDRPWPSKDVNRILGLSTIPALDPLVHWDFLQYRNLKQYVFDSDVHIVPDAVLDNMKRIRDMNGLKCEILGLTWGEWDEPYMNLHPQIVLGADVLYDSTEFDDLFATVAYLLQCSPGGHHLIEFLLAKWGLRCSKLLDAYSFMPLNKACWLKGNIQLVEITIDSQIT